MKIGEYIWNLKYRFNNESWDTFVKRVSDGFKDLTWYIDQKIFLPAGRILATRGTFKLTTMLNCFMSSRIPDSIAGIMDVAKESAQIMKLGGGIGFNFSTIRPRDSLVKSSNGRASGVVSFMHIFDSVCATIKSANNRRGAMMGMLRVDHPDILDFVRAKRKKGELSNFNLSAQLTDEFFDADDKFDLRFGDYKKTVKKQDIIDAIVDNAYEFSEPGFYFIDQANKKDVLYYYQDEVPEYTKIVGTNPCVTEDTLITTDKGLEQVKDLIGKPFYALVNGKRYYCRNGFFFTGLKKVRKIKTKEGLFIKVTEDHKFLVQKGDKQKWVEARYLKKGDKLVLNNLTNFNWDNINKYEYNQGIAFAMTTIKKRQVKKIENKDYEFLSLDFCKGLADGVSSYPTPYVKYSPPTGNIIYYISPVNKLQVALLHGGIMTKCKHLVRYISILDKNDFLATYEGYETLPGEYPVFDCHVEDIHAFAGNGFILHNCGEVSLPYNGVCCLGSINLAKLVVNPFEESAYFNYKEFEKIIRLGIRYLDNILDETVYPTDTFMDSALYTRRIGLGITGYADALIELGLRYGSEKALQFTEDIMEFIKQVSIEEDIKLASEKGMAPIFKEHGVDLLLKVEYLRDYQDDIKKYGLRNSHRLSIAPTGTISLLADNVSSSIEPLFSIEPYQRRVKVEGKDEEDIIDVVDYAYSLYKEKFGRPPKADNIWVKSEDIDYKDHLKTQAVFQKYVDLSISKTINLPADFHKSYLYDLIVEAYQMGLKGLTIFRPNPRVYDTPIITKHPKIEKDNIVIYGQRLKLKDNWKPAILVKYKPSTGSYPYWITVSLNNKNGKILPFQIFLNTKNQDSDYMQLLGRLLTAISIKSSEVEDLDYLGLALEELKTTRVPHEGFYFEQSYHPSYVSGMATIIEDIVNQLNDSEELVVFLNNDYAPCPKCGRLGIPKNGCGSCIYCGYKTCGE